MDIVITVRKGLRLKNPAEVTEAVSSLLESTNLLSQ